MFLIKLTNKNQYKQNIHTIYDRVSYQCKSYFITMSVHMLVNTCNGKNPGLVWEY